MRLRLSIAATFLIGVLAVPVLASGPCLDAGCMPDGGQCRLTSCSCLEGGGCTCTYYCDTNDDQQYDQKCDMTGSDVECQDYDPHPVIIAE